jgi:exopolyphosphatase/pppGpp-phosphohydrolase
MKDEAYSDETIRAVHQLAYNCLEDLGHTNQVTHLALNLFDDLQDLHQLGKRERFLLECGAMLHDIGWVQGQKSHHKNSLQMILDSQVLQFDNKEKLIIGSIARYHRKALPSTSHDHYAVLEQSERVIVDKLAGILRVADGLDYTHGSIVSAIRCEILSKRVQIWCTVSRSAKIEFDRAMTKSDLFEKVFSKKIILVEAGELG